MSRPFPPAKIEFEKRYVLRPVEPADVPQIQRALQASLPELHPFMHWSHHRWDDEKFLERVLHQYANYYKGVDFELGFFERGGNTFLAYTGMFPVNRLNPHCYEIGFWTATAHSGKGYATLATKIEIVLLFEYFKADRIEISCNIENIGSRKVIDKCGFRFEGEIRNYYPRGTEQMFSNGYSRERRVSLFSLTPEDKKHLSWYDQIAEKTTLYPLLGLPQPLKVIE